VVAHLLHDMVERIWAANIKADKDDVRVEVPKRKKAVEVLEMVEVAEKQLDFLSVDFNI
jgi:hypothetical protein